MKRVWAVRLVIVANDPEDTSGDPYYEDQEIPFQLREWFDDALDDRMDHPKIEWAEFTRRPDPKPSMESLPVADTGEINIIRGTG